MSSSSSSHSLTAGAAPAARGAAPAFTAMDRVVDEVYANVTDLHKEHCKKQYRIAHLQGTLEKIQETARTANRELLAAQSAYSLAMEKHRSLLEKTDTEHSLIEEYQERLARAGEEFEHIRSARVAQASHYDEERERLNTIREMFASQIADILASPSSANRGGGAQILGRVEDVRRQIEADPSAIENLGDWFHSIMDHYLYAVAVADKCTSFLVSGSCRKCQEG
ncbi:unnamed protein product (mitochondrion) [Plasmodiophora brassicae]|uniref:Uncharacterized protein n=1 Tax=Plasmodiophora brassicae TaxID=37360 RepID=A0A3P3Y8D8_PLABS|nr:unnamed protein product [Plasmodiophora brassicae]